MARGITEQEPDPRVVYADIIRLPHHQSPVRPHMSMHDRAAQFSPFAALSGYEEMISGEEERTNSRDRSPGWTVEPEDAD